MNILFINHYTGSNIHGMEYRPFYLAREWVKLGHNVCLVAASFSHLRNQQPTLNGKITQEKIEGIRYLWLKTPGYQGNDIKRVFNMLKFSLMLFSYKSEIVYDCKPDVVIASSPHPFMIFGASKIASISRAKLIFEVRDLWPLSLVELGGISHLHPFIKFMQWTENYAYRVSDNVVSLLPKADEYMFQHGMNPYKFIHIPNGIDVKEWENNSDIPLPQFHNNVFNKLKQENRFIIGYTGAHGLANALENLIESAALLQKYPVTFVLVGQGPQKNILQNKVKENGVTNVVFLPAVPKLLIPEILGAMDALFIGWKKESLYRYGISPNKLLDYMMAAKPIIHAVEAGNDIVAESGCGISVPPGNPRVLADAIIQLLNMTTTERTVMGLRGKEYVMCHHDYRVLAKRFLDELL